MSTCEPVPCRLCEGEATFLFERKILRKYEIKYYECKDCGSLQTEEPYWLNEAYADQRRVLDVGAAMRVDRLRTLTSLLFHILKFDSGTKLLDWGGGDGLFVRMLRDSGLQAYHWDTYSENMYGAGFDRDPGEHYDFITSFEVFEHLPYPKQEIEKMFSGSPRAFFATTEIYARQGADWIYLNVLSGRHVFFYSRKAISLIAEKYGYRSEIFPTRYILFYRHPLSRITILWIRILARLNNNRRLSSLLRILLPQNSLTSADKEYTTKAVEQGELWPDQKLTQSTDKS